jgi:hypothetical protein
VQGPLELLTYLNAQAQLPRKDQESLNSNSFVLTRCKNDNEMTTIVPMGTTVDHVTGGGRMEDDGQEGAVKINGD